MLTEAKERIAMHNLYRTAAALHNPESPTVL
jgi:hypothetical protein